MSDTRFTDLLDEYLRAKASWDAYLVEGGDYGPGGQHLYDSMDGAKMDLNEFVAALVLQPRGDEE